MSTARTCPRCGSINTGEAVNCLRCRTPLPGPQEASAPAPAPDAVQALATAAPPPAPQQQTVASPPQSGATHASTRSAGCGSRVWMIVAALVLLLVMAWVGVYVFSNWPPTRAPVAPPVDVGGSAVTEPPVSDISYGTPDLDGYVGAWEFVGEPGPWGEGAPFSLERHGNILVGTVGLPQHYDHTIRLQLAAGNDELLGESTTTYSDGETDVMALRLQLDAGGDLLTVTYRTADGQWLIRVAKRA